MPRLLAVALLTVLNLSLAFAAAPPPRLTPAQRKMLQKSDQQIEQAGALLRGNKKAEAAEAVRRGLDLEREVFGQVRPSRCDLLEALAELCEQIADKKGAERARKEAVRVLTAALGAEHYKTIDARWEWKDGRARAAMTAEQRRQLREAVACDRRGESLWSQGKPLQAVPLYRRALELRRRLHGKKHPSYATRVNNLGFLYHELGDHQAALPLYREALAVRKEALGTSHPAFAASLNNLGALLQDMGDYGAALSLYRQAADLNRQIHGEKHPEYATSLNNLASLYQAMGDYRTALPLFREALEIRKEKLGEKDPLYALSLNKLAFLHQTRGDRKAALALYLRHLELDRQAGREKHPDHARCLNNLALLYREMGDPQAALPLARRAVELYREALGRRHPSYAASLNNLAAVAADRGDFRSSLVLLRKVLQLRKRSPGEKHPLYAQSLNNLAMHYMETGDHKAALPLLKQSLEYYRQAVGEKHPECIFTMNNLAVLHQESGDAEAALPLFQRALELREQTLGEKHPDCVLSRHNLAAAYQGLKRTAKGRRLSDQTLALALENLRVAASVQSERQQLSATRQVVHYLDLRLSFPEPPAGAADTYRHVLARKGAVLLAQQQQRLFTRLLADRSHPAVRQKIARLEQTTRSLASLAFAPVDARTAASRRDQMERLTREKETLERELTELADEFRQARQQSTRSLEQLLEALPADVALVDYLFHVHHDHTRKEADRRYERRLTAFVVRRGQPVVRLDLGQAGQIEKQVAAWRQALVKKPMAREAAGRALRERLWLPVEKYLAGTKTVLVSPDRALAQLPFAALPGRKPGSYLIEEVGLAVVPVPQALPELLAPAKGSRRKPALLVVGDVDFDEAGITDAGRDERAAPRGPLKSWGELPATRAEASAVRDSFTRMFKDGAVADLRKGKPRKGPVRQALSRSRYAHLATHGFFAPAELKSALADSRHDSPFRREDVTGWHPLLLSGLALAGANREPKPGQEDGILTALEVSEMDLGGLELAVLSACETGLGKQAGGEGLLGLQRAFAVAGCKSVVASLWEVPDEATQVLMARFYDNLWRRKMSRLDALREAQRWLLDNGHKHPEVIRGLKRRGAAREDAGREGKQSGRLPPLSWAAFVLSGDWR
jgi:CHAT domain-containing protein/Tfp pilus assembly protein PilF